MIAKRKGVAVTEGLKEAVEQPYEPMDRIFGAIRRRASGHIVAKPISIKSILNANCALV